MRRALLAAAAALLLPITAYAQPAPSASPQMTVGLACQDATGTWYTASPSKPCPTSTASSDTRATGQTINAATLNAAVSVALPGGQGALGFAVSGLTASGATLTAEGSNDGGTTWSAVNTTAPGSGTLSQTVTSDGQFRVNASGHTNVRLRVSSTGTGTITVAYTASAATGLTMLSAPLPAGTNTLGNVGINSPLPAGTNLLGAVGSSQAMTAPSSVLTRPANTTAYAGSSTTPQLIASSTTAGSVVVPSFAIGNSGGYAAIPRLTILTNATSGWGNVSLTVTLWTAAPTYSAGDGGTYAIATGNAYRRVSYTCTLTQAGDGASCQAGSTVGTAPVIHPASGATVYWDIQIASAATPISGQTFTVIPEIWN